MRAFHYTILQRLPDLVPIMFSSHKKNALIGSLSSGSVRDVLIVIFFKQVKYGKPARKGNGGRANNGS
jgi:hypothetical protein